MIDIHLNHINITSDAHQIISHYRKLFIDLDNEIVKLSDDSIGHRQLANARIHLETALLFIIKCIEIQNEIK